MSIYVPKEGETYHYISLGGIIEYTLNENCGADEHLIKSGSCYRTEEDAVRARDRQYAIRELELLADELNDGVEIDWDNEKQPKNYICYRFGEIVQVTSQHTKSQCIIYCSSVYFIEQAFKRLGEDKLKLILDIKE